MEILKAFILAVVQGLAEWFPVSSSSHLIILSKLIGFENTLQFDVALHFGTLMAVFIYFRRDVLEIMRQMLMLRFDNEYGKMGVYLAVATLPILIAGFFLYGFISQSIDDLTFIALGLGITGVFLMIGSLDFKSRKLNYGSALIIGLAQIFSLFRGISRTGSTVSSGLILGLDEKTAVKFSFLLSIPVVFGASVLSIGSTPMPPEFFIFSLVSFVVGLGAIHISYNYVLNNRKNLRWFAAYILLLALGLGIWLLAS